jgi:hypothetical protein
MAALLPARHRLAWPAVFAAIVAMGTASPQDPMSVRALVPKATAYVTHYQQQLTSVVADEDYTQEILAQAPLDPSMPRQRRLRSEVFFVFEPQGQQWMAIRDTILIDGVPLLDRPDVRGAFETLQPAAVAHRFSQLNSRWNLGKIVRNFNEPTIALLVFEGVRAGRFSFDRKSVSRRPDGTLVTLEFRERERPTLIGDLSGRPVYSRGEVVMEPGGRIRHTTFRVETGGVRVELTTEYGPNEKLGIWVPTVFRERYERRRGNRELVVCAATYTNYRRFGVSTRIK